MINKDDINIDFEKELLKMHLNIQTFFKKSILTYMEKISDNAINSFNSSPGNIAYSYLNKVKDQLSKADENIESINNLNNELNNYSTEFNEHDLNTFLTSYNENYEKYMKIVAQNSLNMQVLLNELLNYIKFDFTLFNKTDLLNNLSSTPTIENSENKIVNQNNSDIINEDFFVQSNIIPNQQTKEN